MRVQPPALTEAGGRHLARGHGDVTLGRWICTAVRRTIGVMPKTERIELRVSVVDKEAIASAARLEDVSTTDFVRNAVLDRVAHVRARSERTLMPAEQFDALVASLDTPDDTPNLTRAFAHKRRFTQR